MPGIIHNALPFPQAGASGVASKLADETELNLSALQPPLGISRVRGLGKTTSQLITGPHARSIHDTCPPRVNAEAAGKSRLPVDLDISVEVAATDYGSSGSDHDPSSVSLFAMVHEFIENDGTGEQTGCASVGDGSLNTSRENSTKGNDAGEVPRTVQSLALCTDKSEEVLLRDTYHILNSIAMEVRHMCNDGKAATIAHSCLKRTVMHRLQKLGHIAAICKSKWDHFCGIPAGDYEYIDVLVPSRAPSTLPERLLVDVDFQAQFEIARPTDEFTMVWQLLPPVFVGRPERLKQIIHLLSEATKQSMRVKGLHLPPWRKSAYLKAKWFSSYKRTVNVNAGRPCREGDYSCNSLGFAVRGSGLDVKCMKTLEMLYHDAGSKHLAEGSRDVDVTPRENEITVMMTDWQPPAMVPRCTASNKQGRIMGLTSLLSNAQAPSCNEALVQAA